METLRSASSPGNSTAIGSPIDFTPGQTLAHRYTLVRQLGEGGMGSVYAAHDRRLDRAVAIKAMRPNLSRDCLSIARFSNELRILAHLEGEHIGRILDADSHRGVPFIVLEYLQGQDLADIVGTAGRLSIHEAAAVMLQVCNGLIEIHEAGVIHRDLKPENLMVVEKGDGRKLVKIIDFGISKRVDEAMGALADSEESVGSPDFMAPEQMFACDSVDQRADIWALGGVMYFMVTGRRPFASDSLKKLCSKVLTEPPLLPSKLEPDVPAAFEAVILRCLRKRPEQRYQSARELRTALLSLIERRRSGVLPSGAKVSPRPGSGTAPPRAFPLVRTKSLPRRSHKRLVPTTVASAALVLIMASAAWSRPANLHELPQQAFEAVKRVPLPLGPAKTALDPVGSEKIRQKPLPDSGIWVKGTLPRACGEQLCEGAVREPQRSGAAPTPIHQPLAPLALEKERVSQHLIATLDDVYGI